MKYLNPGKPSASPWSDSNPRNWGVLLGWLAVHRLGMIISPHEFAEISRSWVDEWLLNKLIATTLGDVGLDERSAWQSVHLIKLLVSQTHWWLEAGEGQVYQLMLSVFSDAEAQQYLGVNRYQDILWYNREAFEDFTWWLFIIAVVNIISTQPPEQVAQAIVNCFTDIQRILKATVSSNYQVEKLLAALKKR